MDDQVPSNAVSSGFDLDAIEISDFVSESKVSDAEEVANVMAASCTSCECCCSISSL